MDIFFDNFVSSISIFYNRILRWRHRIFVFALPDELEYPAYIGRLRLFSVTNASMPDVSKIVMEAKFTVLVMKGEGNEEQ